MIPAGEIAGLVLLGLIAAGQAGLMYQLGTLRATVDQHARMLERLTEGEGYGSH